MKLKADPSIVTLCAASFGGHRRAPSDSSYAALHGQSCPKTLEQRHATMTEKDILSIMPRWPGRAVHAYAAWSPSRTGATSISRTPLDVASKSSPTPRSSRMCGYSFLHC
jgi:hypothetical protein